MNSWCKWLMVYGTNKASPLPVSSLIKANNFLALKPHHQTSSSYFILGENKISYKISNSKIAFLSICCKNNFISFSNALQTVLSICSSEADQTLSGKQKHRQGRLFVSDSMTGSHDLRLSPDVHPGRPASEWAHRQTLAQSGCSGTDGTLFRFKPRNSLWQQIRALLLKYCFLW